MNGGIQINDCSTESLFGINQEQSHKNDAFKILRSRSYLPDNKYKDNTPPDSIEPRTEMNNKCYDCKICRDDRKFIQITDSIFTFDGYKDEYTKVELWKCNICNYKYAQEMMSSDVIRVLGRHLHMKYLCKDLKNGVIWT